MIGKALQTRVVIPRMLSVPGEVIAPMRFPKQVIFVIGWLVFGGTSHVPEISEILAVLGSVCKTDFWKCSVI
jgi:hypothetical protein